MLSIIEYTVTAIVCLITAIIIQRIFIKERAKGALLQSVKGIQWFGLAIFAWGLGALGNLLLGSQSVNLPKLLIYWGVLISLANSLFILLSLPSIEHSKERSMVVRMVERFSTKEFIGFYCGILGMITFVFVATSYSNEEISNNFIWLIDIPISVIVALSLLSELNKAFSTRKMRFMYLPTISLFLLIIIAVSHRIIPQDRAIQFIDQDFWALVGGITSISFKFLFILLFSILLYSWKFLSEKEQQQNLVEHLTEEKKQLLDQNKQLTLANESHIDSIGRMKEELEILKESNKVEFSERQKEVLGNLAYCGKEKSYPEIAEAMHISLDGFQTHVHQLKQILNIRGVGGKDQLIKFAQENDFEKFGTLK